MPVPAPAMRPSAHRILPAALLWAGFLACSVGLIVHRMDAVLSRPRVRETLLLALVVPALSWPLARLARWRVATVAALAWALALGVFAGPLACAAALLLAAAAFAVGDGVLPRGLPARGALAVAVGLGPIAALCAWLLPLPVHRWYVYLPVLAALVLWRWRALRDGASTAARRWREATAAAPVAATVAVVVLGLASTACWLPTMQADDVVYHLGLPTQLLADGRYALDPTWQVWSLAPWLGDVLHAIVQVLAGGEARGALNGLWLGLAAAALWACGAGLGLAPRGRWLSIALFASLPMVPALAGGMQTELAATAWLLALGALALAAAPAPLAAALLFGALLGLKASHAFAALPLFAWALWRWRDAWSWPRLALLLSAVLAVGASSYAYAALVSGNPVLPLFNATFRSPYFAARDFDDLRWHAGFTADLPWWLSFDTGAYLEAYPGGFGFVLLALAGAWVLALVRREARGFAAVATLALALPLLPLQYARYAIPGLVLLLPALVLATTRALPPRQALVLLSLVLALDLAFHTNASWMLHSGAVRKVARADGRTPVLRDYLPERLLLAQVRADDPRAVVLATDPDRAVVAEAGRGARNVSWYAPTLEAARRKAERDPSGGGWRAVFDASGARWLLVTPARASAPLRTALAGAGAERIAREGEAELWRLPAGSPR